VTATAFDFHLAPELEAHEPPEARGLGRDQVRLLAASPRGLSHHRFTELPSLLAPGDVLVVNTSATMPAAVSTLDGVRIHFSTELPDGSWVVEPRDYRARAGETLRLPGGATARLREAYSERLWVADLSFTQVPAYLAEHGKPIRYSYVDTEWPVEFYQTVFGVMPGSAEMPSAGRPFTRAIVKELTDKGIILAPILLHTGVASAEAHERPYPERFEVTAGTARIVNDAKETGRRVIAVGTTAVRAIESAVHQTSVTPMRGWTDLMITPDQPPLVTDGLLTGFHEPRASHLRMLAAIAGATLLERCYTEAIRSGYLWHEFGDLNLIVRR
jgi:S-adenosylmethionine:tRNA ribosyltransferase-isomerase